MPIRKCYREPHSCISTSRVENKTENKNDYNKFHVKHLIWKDLWGDLLFYYVFLLSSTVAVGSEIHIKE